MAGSQPRVFVLAKDEAENLARIIRDLTPQRVGNTGDYLFLAGIAKAIDEKFGVTRNVS